MDGAFIMKKCGLILGVIGLLSGLLGWFFFAVDWASVYAERFAYEYAKNIEWASYDTVQSINESTIGGDMILIVEVRKLNDSQKDVFIKVGSFGKEYYVAQRHMVKMK